MPLDVVTDRRRAAEWPGATLGIGVVVAIAFVLQLALAPEACHGTRYPAFCAELALLREATWLGVLLMPFLHGSWSHLGSNLLGLLVFGGGTERLYGHRLLLWLFVAGGYLSTELQLLGKLASDQPPITVGISGAVYCLGAFLAVMLCPTTRSGLADLLDIEGYVDAAIRPPLLVVGLLATAYVLLTHLGVVPTDPRAATLSHLVGTAFGAGTALYLRAVRTDRFTVSIPFEIRG